MAEHEPWLWIIAGPNGAGKTTFATHALSTIFHIDRFINTDEIARLLSPDAPDDAFLESGRLMLMEFARLRDERVSFAVETTLSSTSYLRRAKVMQDDGWRCGMVYVWLDSPQRSRQRVSARVAKGGHNVPSDVIERRYHRSMRNLIKYLDACDIVYVFDNSGKDPIYVGHGNTGFFHADGRHELGRYIERNLDCE